jgi:CxxC motif-containing protein (DUF1111 family)
MYHLRNLRVVFSIVFLIAISGALTHIFSQGNTEAPTGFSTPTLTDNPGSQSTSNGFAYPSGDTFAADQQTFEEQDGLDEGLGPIYNAQSCVGCHQNPVTGGSSQVTELRVGHRDSSGAFVAPTIKINEGQTTVPNRSLVNDRSICAEGQERVPGTENIRTLRMSLNTLGDGFVEAIDDATLLAIAQAQPAATGGRIHGQAIQVPVFEAQGQTRVGRFGWKDQQASLLSFAADAYLNEQGITSRLLPNNTTVVCGITDSQEDGPDDKGMHDIDRFARFMRATMAPPVDSVLLATSDAQTGQKLFQQLGCSTCHVASMNTAPAGTVVNGGQFTIPAALGGKTIHPYSDFLLHDVGTGDGIQQNGPSNTANKLRTPPLWGLRTRDRLMHDGLSLTRNDAILRHGGEAGFVINRYRFLTQRQKMQLVTFLNSL